MDHAHRVMIHMYNDRYKRLKLSPINMELGAYIDAGFATHADGRSHSGMVFTIGNTPFFFKSTKQKRVTLSSTEAEYDALTEGCKYIEWMRNLMHELGITQDSPTIVAQDNRSTITLATQPGTFKRSKQNLVRYHYVKQLIKEQVIALKWVETNQMLADVLTKVLVGSRFHAAQKGLGIV
jgi:ribonuclease HI